VTAFPKYTTYKVKLLKTIAIIRICHYLSSETESFTFLLDKNQND
jgi:hypothetical protein